jgi:hypothetical protein
MSTLYIYIFLNEFYIDYLRHASGVAFAHARKVDKDTRKVNKQQHHATLASPRKRTSSCSSFVKY